MSSKTIDKRSQIPEARFYVLSNDTFMSGWGPARGKINTIILPCESLEEAETVESNCHDRTDQNRVRIVGNKPRLRDGVLYSLLTRETAPFWYQDGAFCRCAECRGDS